MQVHSLLFQRNLHLALQKFQQPPAKRIPKRRMRDHARALEEARGPHALRAIDDLVREDKVAWLDFLAEGADGGEGDDGTDAEGLEGGDVRAGGDAGGCDGVARPVPREKGDEGAAGQLGDCNWRARQSPWLQVRNIGPSEIRRTAGI